MRNLVVCCDGTWNTPDQKEAGVPIPTNVARLYNAVAAQDAAGEAQLSYYHSGVGTEGNWLDRVAGGSVGAGMGKNIQSAYKWLGVNYRPGDRIFLFGFSRGAYTVRSLAGMILHCGLLDLAADGLSDDELWARVETAYASGYRGREERAGWAGDWAFHDDSAGTAVSIYFIGVWDTVGALGVPDDLALLNMIDDPARYAFHDTRLNDRVLNARHAVALDEMRGSFIPTLWTDIEQRPNAKQVWFPGVHSDVGGGYAETGLSNIALGWMMDEAAKLGLAFGGGMREQVVGDPQGVIHDSCTGIFKGLRTQPRSVPPIRAGEGTLHPVVLERQESPPITQAPYRPTICLKTDETREISVYAGPHWNDTGIYLEGGARYRFAASGQWIDRSIRCGPGGTNDGKFQVGELVQMAGSLLGQMEKLFKWAADNHSADFTGTKREEDYPWFALIGAVANGGNPGTDGTPAPHQIFLIGDGCEFSVETGGYLYCFANDSWHLYGNNRGSVNLRVLRLA